MTPKLFTLSDSNIQYRPLTKIYKGKAVYKYVEGYEVPLFICSVKSVNYENETFSVINLCDTKFQRLFPINNISFNDQTFLEEVPIPEQYKDDTPYVKLSAAIINAACENYYAKPCPIPHNLPKSVKKKYEDANIYIQKNKKEAELFFDKSTLFRVTNLNKEYVLEHYKKYQEENIDGQTND